jgi:hypothetical protein
VLVFEQADSLKRLRWKTRRGELLGQLFIHEVAAVSLADVLSGP